MSCHVCCCRSQGSISFALSMFINPNKKKQKAVTDANVITQQQEGRHEGKIKTHVCTVFIWVFGCIAWLLASRSCLPMLPSCESAAIYLAEFFGKGSSLGV